MSNRRPDKVEHVSDRVFFFQSMGAGCLSPLFLFGGLVGLLMLWEMLTDRWAATPIGILSLLAVTGALLFMGWRLGSLEDTQQEKKLGSETGREDGGGFDPFGWLKGFRATTDAAWEAIPKHPGLGYQEYLTTDAWRRKSDFMKTRFGHRCQLCNRRGNLNTHHRTYERVGAERVDDLTVLCRKCHERFHGWEDG